MNDTRTAFELALAADPDNLAAHSAYADWLIEQGDPRGDYIRLQLALWNHDLPWQLIRDVEQQIFDIRSQHEQEWLGPLYQFVHPVRKSPPKYRKKRRSPRAPKADVTVSFHVGWLRSIWVGKLTQAIIAAISTCSVALLLRYFTMHASSDLTAHEIMSLFTIDRFPNLQYLRLMECDFADEGVDMLLDSPLIDRLRILELTGCNITDDGAILFAQHPAIPKLQSFKLDRNLISPIGIQALADVGVTISDNQLDHFELTLEPDDEAI
jgi:uncharacterized protein (TIGR02996 family)